MNLNNFIDEIRKGKKDKKEIILSISKKTITFLKK